MTRKTILALSMALCFLAVGIIAGLVATGMVAPSPFVYGAEMAVAAAGIVLAILGDRLSRREARTVEDQETFQARYSRAFRLFPPIVLLVAGSSAVQLWARWERPGDGMRPVLAALTGVAAFALIHAYAFILSGRSRAPTIRRLIEDEFLQDNLARSRSDGFFALLALIAFCFFAGLFSARLAVALLPFAAGLGVAFAGWRFNRRDAKASAASEMSSLE